jgi:hypothetical protein
MRRNILSALVLSVLASAASAQQAAAPHSAASGQAAAQSAIPHAWLFGEWAGGLFPPPVTLSAQECMANPSVIFTRDAILRAVPTDVTYAQVLVESARAIPGGTEFRLSVPAQSIPSGGPLGADRSAGQTMGFGCENPGVLRVQRRGEDQIAFPGCSDFPYPLVRCPAR